MNIPFDPHHRRTVAYRLTDGLIESVKAQAKARHISPSAVITAAINIDQFITEQEKAGNKIIIQYPNGTNHEIVRIRL